MTEEDLIKEFSLNQKEVHKCGELLLDSIANQYWGLIEDSDICWGLESDIDFLKKLSIIVVRLQEGKKLKETKSEVQK